MAEGNSTPETEQEETTKTEISRRGFLKKLGLFGLFAGGVAAGVAAEEAFKWEIPQKAAQSTFKDIGDKEAKILDKADELAKEEQARQSELAQNKIKRAP